MIEFKTANNLFDEAFLSGNGGILEEYLAPRAQSSRQIMCLLLFEFLVLDGLSLTAVF